MRDQSGAVIPNVQVTATEAATGTISAGLQGFKTFEQGPITLQVQQALELNITLEPGQVSERVTVTAAPPPLETESATVGQVVTTRSILSLPLNIRDPIALIGLSPGVTFGANFGNGGGNDVGRNFFKSDFNVAVRRPPMARSRRSRSGR